MGKATSDIRLLLTGFDHNREFTPALSIGIGGALVAISQAYGWAIYIGVAAALGVQLPLIVVSLLAAYRLPRARALSSLSK